MFDVSFGKSTPTTSPKVSDLTEKVIQDLEMLNGIESHSTIATQDTEMLSDTDSPQGPSAIIVTDVEMTDVSADDESRKRALRLAKSGNSNFDNCLFQYLSSDVRATAIRSGKSVPSLFFVWFVFCFASSAELHKIS